MLARRQPRPSCWWARVDLALASLLLYEPVNYTRGMRRDVACDDCAEQFARAVGNIGGNPLGLEVACRDAIEHGLDRIDLFGDAGWCRLDVDNDRVGQVDQIVEA